MANVFFNKGKAEIMRANVDLESDTIKLLFMTVAYTPDVDADEFLSDVSGEAASGITAQTLASKTVTEDDGNNRAEFDAADISVPSITTITNKFVLYKDTGVAATSPLLCCIDIVEGTLTPINGTIAVAFNAEGIFAF